MQETFYMDATFIAALVTVAGGLLIRFAIQNWFARKEAHLLKMYADDNLGSTQEEEIINGQEKETKSGS